MLVLAAAPKELFLLSGCCPPKRILQDGPKSEERGRGGRAYETRWHPLSALPRAGGEDKPGKGKEKGETSRKHRRRGSMDPSSMILVVKRMGAASDRGCGATKHWSRLNDQWSCSQPGRRCPMGNMRTGARKPDQNSSGLGL